MKRRALRWVAEVILLTCLGALAALVSAPILILGAIAAVILIILLEGWALTRGGEAAQPPPNQQTVGTVISIGQQGGQTAGQITNIGQQPRTLQRLDLSQTISRLSKYSGTAILVASLTLDGESNRFADDIADVLRRSGWQVSINRTLLGHFRGIGIRTPESILPPSLEELSRCLVALGFSAEVAVGSDQASGNEILILGN